MLKVIHPGDEPGIRELLSYIEDKEYIAFDVETTGLDHEANIIGFSMAAEDRAYYVITAKWDADTQKLLTFDNEKRCIQALQNKCLIMHNGTFDSMMVKVNYKIDLMPSLHTDTMILAHLLDENRRVGLKELAKQYFGVDSTKEAEEVKASVIARGGKASKSNYELYKADPDIIGKYGAQDALLTYRLFWKLTEELFAQNLQDFFYSDESMPLLRGPTYEMNSTGLKIDQQAIVTLQKTLEAECLEAKNFIYSEIDKKIKEKYPGTTAKNTFNIGSPQQLSWLLFGAYDLDFNTLTAAGKKLCKSYGLHLPYSAKARRDFIKRCSVDQEPWKYIACDKKVLSKLAPVHKWIAILLEHNKKTKLLNTYVIGIQERIKYGIIRPSFLQHGTTSGRYSSRNPNFQNLPRDDKRIKACVVARPGKVFVGADYSQLEPRVFAYFSGDERLLAAFTGADDFYSVIGMGVYHKEDCIPRKDGSPDAFGIKYKKLRDLSKVIALASTYGATANQLAPTTGKSIAETQKDIDDYFASFPGVKQMMLDSHQTAKSVGYVKNYFGRPRRIPEAQKIEKIYGPVEHAELPYEARSLLNLAVNHRIQSTGASIVNRAAIAFCNKAADYELDCKIVLQVHDSLIVECKENEAEVISSLLQYSMEETVQLEGIRFEAVPKIGKTLADV